MRNQAFWAIFTLGISSAFFIGYSSRPEIAPIPVSQAETTSGDWKLAIPTDPNMIPAVDPIAYAAVENHFRDLSAWQPLGQISLVNLDSEIAPMPRVK
jgi:hypothetical protein